MPARYQRYDDQAPAREPADKIQNSQYQYTFDNEGRVSTIVVTSTFHNPESMENISIATQTEYTLHYGTTPSPEPDYLAYLTDQKIIEEGTLGYIFDGDDPEGEHIVLPNAYTSYAKILNTLSDGTTKETTEYRQVKITLPEEHLGYIYVTQQDIDDFELISVTQEKRMTAKILRVPSPIPLHSNTTVSRRNSGSRSSHPTAISTRADRNMELAPDAHTASMTTASSATRRK